MVRRIAILLFVFGLAAIVLIAIGLVGPSRAQQAYTHIEPTAKELDASLRTDWFGVYLQGKKIGYMRMSRERTPEGIREEMRMHMKLVAQNQKDELTVRQSYLFEAKPPYALLKAEYNEDAGATASQVVLNRKGPRTYDAVQTVGKSIRKKTLEGVDFRMSEALLAAELWVRRGPTQDAAIAVGELNAKEESVDTITNKILRSKTSFVGGVEVKYYEIESTSALQKTTWLSRYDEQGKMLSGKLAVFEFRAESEEQAKNAEYSQDLFVLGMVKVERPLGNLRNVEELVLEVDGTAKVFADGPRQSVAVDNGRTNLRLGKRFGKEARATADDRAQNLKETSAYFLSDSKVKALAALAVGNAATDEAKVKSIAKFVHDFIDPRFGFTFPTIQNLIEKRQGDCKSYALLFANLARASGVPCREVAGLLYCGDDTQAFGGHAWNEVILGGVWVPVDASLNETEINATHLSCGAETTGLKNMLETLGNLKLRVVEVKTR